MSNSTDSNIAKPKRPLSAYNLFYRFKRFKMLEAHKKGDDSTEIINRLIAAVPGLEDHPSIGNSMSPEQVKELSRIEIRAALLENLSPKDTSKRTHRKSHGALSFLEMSKIMVASWKSIDDFTHSVFDELAEEGRRVYRKRVAEHNEKYPSSLFPPKKKIKSGGPAVHGTPKNRHVGNNSTSPNKNVTGYYLDFPSTPKKKIKSTSSIVTPKKTQSKMLHIAKPSSRLTQDNDAICITPNAIEENLHPIVSSVTATNISVSYFDCLDLDLASELEPELISPFSDIFELGGSSGNDLMRMDSSVQSSSEFILNNFPYMPFLVTEKQYEIEPSANDFMELIARLDESL